MKKYLKSEKFDTALYFAICISCVLLVYWLHSIWQANRFMRTIPLSLEISSTVETGTEFQLIGGCGAGAFRLTSAVANKIKQDGLIALSDAKKARDYGMTYNWQKTPIITDEKNYQSGRWIGGIACGILNSQLRQNILGALNETGSFYSVTDRGGLIVLPQYNLVVISINGGR
jgi:hypothetical protein